ncbi:MAG TPA: hypothetical protein VM686_25645 [Polyangiaceae bacterium]|nr:hypothetical protein [Polyangiaceae bacterium]
MRSTIVGAIVLASLSLLCACSGADDGSDFDEQAGLGEIAQAQARSPTQGGACTIETCAGTKDPFGTYNCDKNGKCACVRGGTSGSCDSEGKNCKEKCETTTSRPPPVFEVDPSPGEVWAGEEVNHVELNDIETSEVAP